MKKLNKNFRSTKMTVESMVEMCVCNYCSCNGFCGTSTPSESTSTANAVQNGVGMYNYA